MKRKKEKTSYQRSNEEKKIRKKLEKTELAIAEMDEKISKLDEEMHSDEVNSNAELLLEKMEEMEVLKKEHDRLMEVYIELADSIENA